MEKNAIIETGSVSSEIFSQVVNELQANGFNVHQQQPAMGLIFGSIEENEIKKIRQIKNVKNAELDKQVTA